MSWLTLLVFVLLASGIFALVRGMSSRTRAEVNEPVEPVQPHVVIYTKASCDPCDRAKVWMTRHQVVFEERDVQASPAYEQELKDYKSRIVPVIVVNGEPLYGFQFAYLEEALKKAGSRRRP